MTEEITAVGRRIIKDGTKFNHLFPNVKNGYPVINPSGNIEDVVGYMLDIVAKNHNDTVKLAKLLDRKDLYELCKNIFDFAYNYIQYSKDEKGKEQLRRPARTWHDRVTGVDCDDYSIFVGSVLYNLDIPFEFRIAKYGYSPSFQHVYVVVPRDKDKQKYYIIDPVLNKFNYEKLYSEKKDFNMKALKGIPVQYLNGINGADMAEMVDVIVGNDLKGIENGLGTAEEQDESMLNYLKKTRKQIAQNPDTITQIQNPKQMLEMFDYAIKYWNTPQREKALETLAKKETELIEKGHIILSGFEAEDFEEEWEEDKGFTGVEGEDDGYVYEYYDNVLGDLGKAKRQKKEKGKGGFFRKVGQGIKKGLKTAVKSVVKFNPLSIAARNGFLLAMKINMLNMADKLMYGYLTEEQAKARGMDITEWRKVKTALDNTEKMFVNTLKGKAENLKKAILSGKRKDLRGLGVEPVTTAAGTAAASGFIAKVGQWIKGINPAKLFKKNPEKQAFKQAYTTEQGGSSKGWRKEYKAGKSTTSSAPATTTKTGTATQQILPQTQEAEYSEEQGSRIMSKTASASDDTEKKSFIQKAGEFVKKHKVATGIGVLAVATGITLAVSEKARKAIGLSKKSKSKADTEGKDSEGKSLSGTKKKIDAIKLT